MTNVKFYEAVLRGALPISKEYANEGWPPLLYPFFLACIQLPAADTLARRAFTYALGDSIRAGALPAVRQRIPWFIEDEVIEPHVSASNFADWLADEQLDPSPLTLEWLKSQGVGSASQEESIEQRNARWLAVFDEERRKGPETGAQARAVRHIAVRDGVSESRVKKAIQTAEKARAERYRAGGARAIKTSNNTANNPFNVAKSRTSKNC